MKRFHDSACLHTPLKRGVNESAFIIYWQLIWKATASGCKRPLPYGFGPVPGPGSSVLFWLPRQAKVSIVPPKTSSNKPQ